MRRARSLLAHCLVIAIASSCIDPADAGIPVGLEDEVASAQRSLQDHWDNGPNDPTFTFSRIRCRADGGLLVLFDQQGFGADGLAFAMQGPDAMPDAWAGGFAPVDPATDPEIAHFFSEAPEVACR